MLSDPLDLPATTERLGSLASKNVLPEAALERALELASPPPSAEAWRVYLSRTFLGLGAALCGAGVVTFIAFNWAALGRFAKLGLVGALIVACATAGFRTVPKLRGRIALAAAAILVGPLFAIYGQAYQTGADPFELFVAWAALTLLWTVAADLSGLWLFCLALIEVALALYWEQVLQPAGDREELALFLVLAAVNLTALAIWEIRMRRTAAAESGRWMPRTLAGFAVASLVVPAVAEVADLHHVEHGGATRVLAFVAFVATTAFLGLVLTGTGAGLRRVSRTVFLQQLALALALSGEVLLIAGLAYNGHEQSVAAMVLAVELVMLALYPEAVHRFLSTLACAGAAAVLVSRVQSPIGSDAYVVAVAIAAGLAFVWQPSAAARWWTWLPGPVGHALVLAGSGLILLAAWFLLSRSAPAVARRET